MGQQKQHPLQQVRPEPFPRSTHPLLTSKQAEARIGKGGGRGPGGEQMQDGLSEVGACTKICVQARPSTCSTKSCSTSACRGGGFSLLALKIASEPLLQHGPATHSRPLPSAAGPGPFGHYAQARVGDGRGWVTQFLFGASYHQLWTLLQLTAARC